MPLLLFYLVLDFGAGGEAPKYLPHHHLRPKITEKNMDPSLDTGLRLCYNIPMNEDDYDYGYDEGSDIDNYEDEQVFQDHEGEEEEDPIFLNHFQILLRTMEMIRK